MRDKGIRLFGSDNGILEAVMHVALAASQEGAPHLHTFRSKRHGGNEPPRVRDPPCGDDRDVDGVDYRRRENHRCDFVRTVNSSSLIALGDDDVYPGVLRR